jgi:hypothetical protein
MQLDRLDQVGVSAPLTSGVIALLREETTRQVSTYDRATRGKTVHVPRGATVVLADVKGTGMIRSLWMTFPGWFWAHWAQAAPVSQTILKTLILRIYWDGAEAPAVESPVGDFFGNGLCTVRSFAGAYFGMSSGGFYCRFPMPFRSGFRVEVENRDAEIDTVVFANILYQQSEELPEDAAYFHAQFRTGPFDGGAPMRVCEVMGRGHFAGLTFSAQCRQRNTLHYLESPEFVYVDDDWAQPRYTGTGLEDYFLGGWYFREGEFTGALHGVTTKDPFDSSVALYRVHDADAVSFRERLRFEFHNHDGRDETRPCVWSSTSYLYLDTPVGAHPRVPGPAELLCWYRIHDCDHASVP